MNKINCKIAVRTFFKSKWYNLLNITGLALGLAGFMLVSLYVKNETSYDQWNENADRIYLIETETPNGPSPYTPGKLADAIKSQCPEVEETGRTNTALFEVPFFTPSGKFIVKKWVGADYSIAKILGIKPKGFKLDSGNTESTILLSKKTASVLFPRHTKVENSTVNMVSKSGFPITVAGVAADAPGNTHLAFDCIGFSKDVTSGKDQSFTNQIYQTYIMVRPKTDIGLLSKKIDQIYKEGALSDTSQIARTIKTKSPAIYLDPLTNLHLKPHYGSSVNDQVVKVLIALALIILLVTCVNFTSLYIAQAYKRAKEIGVKKVNGVLKWQIIAQFLSEIFIQCLIALVLSLYLVSIGLPYFSQLLQVNLLISGIDMAMLGQLILVLITITILAGIYPSLVLAGFKPAEVLSGTQLSKGKTLSIVRNSITVFQFTFAVIFMIILIVINQQVKYMQTQEPGFKAEQVVYINNLTLFNTPKSFQSLRDRIKAIPGVNYVTVASHVPGGIPPVSHEYTIQNKVLSFNTIGVDYEYFETLSIKLKTGRLFSATFKGDSTVAIVNEAAAQAMDLNNPIGRMVAGCNGNYRIVGVIHDVKAYGFEESVKPTIYLLNNACNIQKIQIMINAQGGSMKALLNTLNSNWADMNKLDGENFNYHFLDELYAQLFVKQEQLRSVLIYFSALAMFIAALGIFSSAAHDMRIRMKEIAIRKILGAGQSNLMLVLNKPFFYMIFIANLIAWPVALIIVNKWLATFAYRIPMSVSPFMMALAVSIIIVVFTVGLQTMRAIRVKPVSRLKD